LTHSRLGARSPRTVAITRSSSSHLRRRGQRCPLSRDFLAGRFKQVQANTGQAMSSCLLLPRRSHPDCRAIRACRSSAPCWATRRRPLRNATHMWLAILRSSPHAALERALRRRAASGCSQFIGILPRGRTNVLMARSVAADVRSAATANGAGQSLVGECSLERNTHRAWIAERKTIVGQPRNFLQRNERKLARSRRTTGADCGEPPAPLIDECGFGFHSDAPVTMRP